MHIVEAHQEALYHIQNVIAVLHGNEWSSLKKSLIAELYLQFICIKKSVSNWHSAQDSVGTFCSNWYMLP
jgi:hypothetical protein